MQALCENAYHAAQAIYFVTMLTANHQRVLHPETQTATSASEKRTLNPLRLAREALDKLSQYLLDQLVIPVDHEEA
jgi:hypothetical protein